MVAIRLTSWGMTYQVRAKETRRVRRAHRLKLNGAHGAPYVITSLHGVY